MLGVWLIARLLNFSRTSQAECKVTSVAGSVFVGILCANDPRVLRVYSACAVFFSRVYFFVELLFKSWFCGPHRPTRDNRGAPVPKPHFFVLGAGRLPIGLIKPVRVEVADPGLKRSHGDLFRSIFVISAR